MKRFFTSLILSLLLLPVLPAKATENDSIRLSLLTCSPGKEIYSLFGHTALRYQYPAQGIDVIFNYGLFSFNTPHFILRFALGETDYQLGVTDYSRFAREYAFSGRNVWQQTLNLDDTEKTKLIQLLQENYRPENRVYRYNFFYDNCSTRPRDKIEESLSGKISYPAEPQDCSRTYRDIIHQYCQGHPWSRFGIDLCIGSEADRPITQRQMMFAPFYLKDAFEQACIQTDSVARPLVSDSREIIETHADPRKESWTPTPWQCTLFLFILTAGATLYSIRRRTSLWGIDLLLFGTAGIAGCILAFLALFSEHPAVSANYQLFVLHPGHLLFLPYIIYCERKRKKCAYLSLNLVVLTLFIVLFPLIPQRIDFAVVPLALCLLIRSANNLIVTSKKKE